MSRLAKLMLSGVMLGGAFAAAPLPRANAQTEITDTDCTYGSYIVNDSCQGATTRCCKCKLGCAPNQT